MSFLAAFVKPLAYMSLPVLLFRTIASTSPLGRYYWRLSLYLSSLAAASTWGVFIALGMSLVGRRHDVNYVVAKAFYAVASRLLDIYIDLEGEEHLQTRPAVLISNHQSFLDIIFLGKIFPKQTSIMAKKSLQWSPLGPWMYMSGALFVDRGNSEQAYRSLEAAGRIMKAQSTSLVIFPEGTRHSEKEPDLLPFKKGAFYLAIQTGLPIVPVVCENYWRIYHNNVFDSDTLKVRVLPPISTAGLTTADVSALATRVRDQMLAVLREISVKVASEEKEESLLVHQPEEEPDRVPSEQSGLLPGTSSEILPGVQETSSEESAENGSESQSQTRSVRMEGSEYGTETEEDEGMVLVGRPRPN